MSSPSPSSSPSQPTDARTRTFRSNTTTSDTRNIEDTAETLRVYATRIREASARMRDTVITLRRSGAIDEIALAIREAVIATRDTTRELNDTAKDLKERGIIKDTANAIEETNLAARETIHTSRDIASEAADSAPNTTRTVKEAANKLRPKRKRERESSLA